MSVSLTLAAVWALAATVVALLPMRWQFPPGVVLLGLAPIILIFLARDHGLWVFLLGFAGFVSMFRRPLLYYGRRIWAGRAENSDGKGAQK